MDVIMLLYNLLEYSVNYSKAFESLWQNYRVELALDNGGAKWNFPGNHFLFICKVKIRRKNVADSNAKDVEIR